MAGPSISEYQLKTRKEFYAYLDSKRKEGNSRFSLSLEKDPFSFSLYLLFRTTAAWRLQIVVWQNMSFQSNHPE